MVYLLMVVLNALFAFVTGHWFDKIVSTLHRENPEIWKRFHQPPGFFYYPDRDDPMMGARARQLFLGAIWIYTPEWAREIAWMKRPLSLFRWSTLAMQAAIIGGIVALVMEHPMKL